VERRRCSGAAHGLPWSVLGRQGTQAGAADADEMATFRTGGSIDALANSHLRAHGLLANAFKHLDRRGAPETWHRPGGASRRAGTAPAESPSHRRNPTLTAAIRRAPTSRTPSRSART